MRSTLALLVLAAPASAQYAPQQVIENIGSPIDVQFDDSDGDGDLDLIVASANFNLRYFENLADGTFGTSQLVDNTIGAIRMMRMVDIDGLGGNDIVIATGAGDGLVWLPWQGPGQYGAPVSLPPALFRANCIDAGDVDGDGDMDVVAGSSVLPTDTVAWFENQGGGVFGMPQVLTTGSDNPTDLALADFDGNGTLDLVVGSSTDDKLVRIQGNGDGTFGGAVTITTGVDDVRSVHAADMDDDGLNDLLVASFGDDTIGHFRNLGAFAFGARQAIDNAADGADFVTAVDLDLDGDLDVLATAETGSSVRIYDNVGFGFFGVPVELTGAAPSTAILATAAAAADVDGDADIDVVSVSRGDSKVALYERDVTLGSTHCTSNPNSTGVAGVMTLTGSTFVSQNAMVMTATELPPSSFGFFLASQTSGMVANPAGSEGVLCLGGSIGRYVGPGQIQFTGAVRRMRLPVDLSSVPSPTGPVQATAGQTWFFQGWHRDTVGGVATSNFTDGVQVMLR